MPIYSRWQKFNGLFPGAPPYRRRQLEQAEFQPQVSNWAEVKVIPQAWRETLGKRVPWNWLSAVKIAAGRARDAYKALLQTTDKQLLETVLMQNAKQAWTVCLSSQIGCAMGCVFCATGALGLKRNLSADEIVDQLRFWLDYKNKNRLAGRISNLVLMGMGEPLANYEQVKLALKTILANTDIGLKNIMVSTAGLLPQLEILINDVDWPNVRLAISLHSADAVVRKNIMPSTAPDFHRQLADWTFRYQKKLGNRQHYLTFEYVLIKGINDSPAAAKQLAVYTKKTAVKKINVIPYNPAGPQELTAADQQQIDQFKAILRDYDIDVTQRRSLGADIQAACGQLAGSKT